MEYGVWSMEYGVKSKQTETLNFPDSLSMPEIC